MEYAILFPGQRVKGRIDQAQHLGAERRVRGQDFSNFLKVRPLFLDGFQDLDGDVRGSVGSLPRWFETLSRTMLSFIALSFRCG